MFAANSRYQNIATSTHRTEDGREIAYVRRRFLPRGDDMPVLVDVEVTERDRLDLISARTLGDAEQFWRVCDANNAMSPFELVAHIGRRIRVALPQFEEV